MLKKNTAYNESVFGIETRLLSVFTSRSQVHAFFLTFLAMIAFAANSVLCRLALGTGSIDAGSFTAIRLGSGAIVLVLLVARRNEPREKQQQGSWISGAMLFLYAAAFSFAYRELTAGTGALLLFGAVQLTMLLAAVYAGERPPTTEWSGLALAFGGLVYLVLPGLRAPAPLGTLLMAVSGLAWGVYSLRGRGAGDPLGHTAGNFLRSVPFAVAIGLATLPLAHLTAHGVGLAILSGAVTSGLGYVAWYAALRNLTATRAALVQLSVPVIAAIGGMLFLAEAITLRLIIASALVLGGIGLAVNSRPHTKLQKS